MFARRLFDSSEGCESAQLLCFIWYFRGGDVSPAILMFALIRRQTGWLLWKRSACFCNQRSKEILSDRRKPSRHNGEVCRLLSQTGREMLMQTTRLLNFDGRSEEYENVKVRIWHTAARSRSRRHLRCGSVRVRVCRWEWERARAIVISLFCVWIPVCVIWVYWSTLINPFL